MADWKSFKVRDLKAADGTGEVEAVFATLNVVDSDGDRILPGAIGEQQVRLSAYGHGSWHGALPVGKGRVFERGDDAVFAGRFFTETEAGSEHYKTVKAMGDLQEWSFALPEIDAHMVTEAGNEIREITRVSIPEVSPVLMGAGVATRTLSIKEKSKPEAGARDDAPDPAEQDAEPTEAPKAMRLLDHIGLVSSEVAELVTRLGEVKALREADGRSLSEQSREQAEALKVALGDAHRELERILSAGRDEPVLAAEFLRFQQIAHNHRRVL